jgi:glycosyltransferase involved in cell wall biosynthesis
VSRRLRLLIVAQDRLDGQFAGTSIRALELARALREDADVTLAAVGTPPREIDGLPCVGYHPQDPRALRGPLAQTDAVLSVPQWPLFMRTLRRSGARLIFDLYVPEALETMGGFPGDRPRVRRLLTQFAIDRAVGALRAGDHLVCASEKQRDLWLGALLAERLISPARSDADPSLRSLIDVVPFGLPAEPPVPSGEGGPRRRFAGAIGPEDEIVLWNGGLWPWLDPETAIRAVDRLVRRRPQVRLVFMGAARQLPAQRTAERARALAADLGLLDRIVLFNDEWVPFEKRADWLLEADCALSTHDDHLETRFAFRTRMLDCFWTGLPVVCTGGDDLGSLVERERLGAIVGPRDPEAAADALESVLTAGRAAFAPRLAAVAAAQTWSQVAEPLRRMLASPPPPARARPRPLAPGHTARDAGYTAARLGLNLVGARDWPRL